MDSDSFTADSANPSSRNTRLRERERRLPPDLTSMAVTFPSMTATKSTSEEPSGAL